MDYLLLARVAKGVALIGFFLPWVTVSCSGTEILSATGLQLMTGDLQPSGAFAQMESQQTDDAEPSIGVIAAFAVAVIGLSAGLLLKGKRAAGAIVAAAVLSIGLSYFSIQNMRSELTREASQAQPADQSPFFSADQQRELAQAAASAIRIEEQEGYWLSLGAMGVAAILALLVLAGASTGAARKEGAAP